MNLDFMNAGFEIGGALAAFQNVIMTHRAKRVVGVSMIATAWFSSWGFFNVFYYHNLNQPLSNAAALLIALVNTFWLGQIWYYNKRGSLYENVSKTC